MRPMCFLEDVQLATLEHAAARLDAALGITGPDAGAAASAAALLPSMLRQMCEGSGACSGDSCNRTTAEWRWVGDDDWLARMGRMAEYLAGIAPPPAAPLQQQQQQQQLAALLQAPQPLLPPQLQQPASMPPVPGFANGLLPVGQASATAVQWQRASPPLQQQQQPARRDSSPPLPSPASDAGGRPVRLRKPSQGLRESRESAEPRFEEAEGVVASAGLPLAHVSVPDPAVFFQAAAQQAQQAQQHCAQEQAHDPLKVAWEVCMRKAPAFFLLLPCVRASGPGAA